jgi:hypothetical protein
VVEEAWYKGRGKVKSKAVVRVKGKGVVRRTAWYKRRGKVKGKAVVKVNGNGKGVVRNGVVEEAW